MTPAHDLPPPARGAAHAVAHGTTRLLGGMIAAKSLDLALYLLLARALGVESFGRYAFALSFALLFGTLADLGLVTVFVREVARAPHRARALLGPALRLKLALAAATVALTAIAAVVTRAPAGALPLVAAISIGMLVNSSATLFDGLLRARERAAVNGVVIFFQSFAGLLVAAVLLTLGFGPLAGALGYIAAALVHLALSAWATRADWRAAPAPAAAALRIAPADAADDPAAAAGGPMRYLAREAAPLALSTVFIALYFRVDAVLLQMLQGERAVGLYAGAYRLFESLLPLFAAYRMVVFPIMSRRADGPADALGMLLRKSLRVNLLFTVGAAAFVSAMAPRLLALLVGEAYAPAALTLSIVIWALPWAFMADLMFHVLAAQRRQRAGTIALGIAAAANVALNLVLIPRFSHHGAAVATLATELLSFTLLYLAFARGAAAVGFLRLAWRPALAAGALAGGLAVAAPALPAGAGGLVLAAVLGLGLYGAALVVTGAVGPEDARLARAVLLERAGRARPAS